MSTDPGEPGTGATATEYDMAIRLERLHVQEALNARDVAVERLADACVSLRETTVALNLLRMEKDDLQKRLGASNHNKQNTVLVDDGEPSQLVLVEEIDKKFSVLQISNDGSASAKENVENSSGSFEPTVIKFMRTSTSNDAPLGLSVLRDLSNTDAFIPLSSPCNMNMPVTPSDVDAHDSPWISFDGEQAVVALPTVSTVQKIEARYAVLASLPLPSDIPEDSLTPILIPAPYTLHDFIVTTSGFLRSQLGNYRVFQQATTTWCPEREEHGYCLTPLYKCNTNPRVSTAHRWNLVDISANLDKPTECFFNKDGKWYYAGIYKSFRLEDLCTQEWECLSPEASQALIKETLAARKNTSPQNIYETGQLYSAGALKVACIGLQCIGFNNTLYRSLLEHAALCTQTGKWRAPAGGFGTGLGLTTPGMPWTARAHGPGSPVLVTVRGLGPGPGAVHPTPLLPMVKIPQDVSASAPATPGGLVNCA